MSDRNRNTKRSVAEQSAVRVRQRRAVAAGGSWEQRGAGGGQQGAGGAAPVRLLPIGYDGILHRNGLCVVQQ